MDNVEALTGNEKGYNEKLIGDLDLIAKPGQDQFNLPGLHTVDNISLHVMPFRGDFTLTAKCCHDGQTKFDASGLYVCNEEMKCKFGVELSEGGRPRIISVHTKKYSDEAAGEYLSECSGELMLSRSGNIITCYTVVELGVIFHRALFLEKENETILVGFFAQAPFSINAVQASFRDIISSPMAKEHSRL